MADKKISQLTGASTPLAGTEVLPIVQGGSTVKVSVDNLTAGRTVSASTVNATTVDATNVEVTNIKAKDGTAAATIADSTGVVSLSESLGIGTTAPNLLTWAKAVTLNDPSNGAYELAVGGVAQAYFAADTTNVYVASFANKPLLMRTNNLTRATFDTSGNLLLGGSSSPASAASSLAIFNGTAPTGSVANGCVLYAEDVSSSSELKVRDEAGNVTTLSPHNFSLIPEGPSENMAWAYYSEKDGKRINVDMLKLARMVEKLTGEKLVYEA